LALGRLGPEYMADPCVGRQLFEVLLRMPNAEKVIDQAWLDIRERWCNPDTIYFLVDVNDLWDRRPEPLRLFILELQGADIVAWHHFVDVGVFEDDPELAQLIYDRFSHEGPTNEVLQTMCCLRHSLESDHYADKVMAPLINRCMRDEAPCPANLLKLWRRYCVTDGVDDGAISLLAPLLAGGHYADAAKDAMRVVDCLKISQLPIVLGAVVELAAASVHADASRRARRLLVAVSDTHVGVRIAYAIEHGNSSWLPYMARLHIRTLWYLMDYMAKHGAVTTMQSMYDAHPACAVECGLVTRLLCCTPPVRSEMPLYVLQTYPAHVHTAIYYMFVNGKLPPDMKLFHQARRQWPAVFKTLCIAPAINCELKWARRKGLLVAMARCARLRARRGGHSVLLALAANEAIWPCVLKFI